MTTLTVRKVDDRIARVIKERAKKNGCSMEAQVRTILEHTAQQWQREEQQPKTGYEMAMQIRELFADIDGADDLADVLDNMERPPAPDPVSLGGESYQPV